MNSRSRGYTPVSNQRSGSAIRRRPASATQSGRSQSAARGRPSAAWVDDTSDSMASRFAHGRTGAGKQSGNTNEYEHKAANNDRYHAASAEEISQAVSQAEQELTRYYAERQMRNAEAPREQAPAQKVVAYRFANGNPVRIMVDEDAGLDDATFKPKRSRRVSRAEAEKIGDKMYKRALEHQQRSAQQASKVPTDCTFTPTVTSKAKRLSNKSGKERFAMLYEHAKLKSERLEQMRKRADGDNTFKPAITARAASVGRRRAKEASDFGSRLYSAALESKTKKDQLREELASAGKHTPTITSKARRLKGRRSIQNLYVDKDAAADRERERAAKKAELESQECTFKPRINRTRQPRNKSMERRPGAGNESVNESVDPDMEPGGQRSSVFDRLYEHADLIRQKIDSSRRERAEEELADATFRPRIMPSPLTGGMNPGGRRMSHDGVVSFIRGEEFDTAAALGDLSGVWDKNDQSGRSYISEAMVNHTVGRLYAESAEIEARREMRRAQIAQAEGATFTPRINPRSARIASRNRARSVNADGDGESQSVFDRLFETKPDRSTPQHYPTREELELAECTFAPKISDTPNFQGRLSHSVMDDSDAEGDADGGKSTASHGGPRSTRTEKTAPVWERLYQETQSNNELQALRQEIKHQKELEECTFKPRLSRGTSDVASRLSRADNIWEQLYSEAKKTRSPRGAKTPQPASGKKPASGMKKAQSMRQSGGSADGEDIWKRLYEQSFTARQEREAAQQHAEKKEMEACTFRPAVSSGPNNNPKLVTESQEDFLARLARPKSVVDDGNSSVGRHTPNSRASRASRRRSGSRRRSSSRTPSREPAAVVGGQVMSPMRSEDMYRPVASPGAPIAVKSLVVDEPVSADESADADAGSDADSLGVSDAFHQATIHAAAPAPAPAAASAPVAQEKAALSGGNSPHNSNTGRSSGRASGRASGTASPARQPQQLNWDGDDLEDQEDMGGSVHLEI